MTIEAVRAFIKSDADAGMIKALLCDMQARVGGAPTLALMLQSMLSEESDRPRVVLASEVDRKPVRWLWTGFIPFGMITLLMGDPGQGKGTLCIDLAARFTTGRPMPLCGLGHPAGNVLLLTTAEDDAAYTICPRLEAAGADMERVVIVQDLLSLPGDVPKIAEMIREHHCGLAVIDPLNAYLSAKIDSHVDQDVRRALSPLKLVFEETGAAGLIVGHLNKGGNGGPAIYRGGGSIGIVGTARAVFAVGADPAEPGRRVLAPVKMNIAEKPPTLTFTLESDARLEVGRIEWGETVALSADDVLTWRPGAEREQQGDRAEEWYRERLGDGKWHLSKEVEEEREAVGIAERTAKRARKALNVGSKRIGFGSGAVWYVGLSGAVGPPFDAAQKEISIEGQSAIECQPPLYTANGILCTDGTRCSADEDLPSAVGLSFEGAERWKVIERRNAVEGHAAIDTKVGTQCTDDTLCRGEGKAIECQKPIECQRGLYTKDGTLCAGGILCSETERVGEGRSAIECQTPIECQPPLYTVDGTLCTGGTLYEADEDMRRLHRIVAAGWRHAGLEASAELLERLLGRAAPDLDTALATSTPAELEILLRYGRDGR
jgi:hypothetical protein